jgi:carboxypeptidase Q
MSTEFKTKDALWWRAKEMKRLFEARSIVLVFIFLAATNAVAADGTGQIPQDAVQPVSERVDLDMYSRIRAEGLQHSRIMDYATALFDDIGPRLTGSSNLARATQWTREQFAAMGANAYQESWGEFGMGWRQIATSIDMSSPDNAVLIGQASPWSPATAGAVHANVVAVPFLTDEKGLDVWMGRLTGKVLLYGKPPAIVPDPKPLLEHYDAEKLQQIFNYPLKGDFREQHVFPDTPQMWTDAIRADAFQEKVAKFFAKQGALAVFVPSYAGDGGIIRDDNNESLSQFVYLPGHKQPIPSAVLANEAFGRISRLLEHQVPVSVDVNIHTEFSSDHEPGYNIIAEIRGTDPKLKDEVVMAGAHLDSWIAGTGATDDGVGVIVTMEAMRILTALHVQPRRTIRVALWSGEEQGNMGSFGYVKQHVATIGTMTTPDAMSLPEAVREIVGPVKPGTEYDKLSVYFNLDNGGGKLLGIYAEDNAAAAPIFEKWIAPLKDLGVTTVTLRPSGSSDQDSFDNVGIPAFQFIQDPRDYATRSVHTNQDTYERLSPEDLKQAAVVEATFLYDAAMRDEMLPRKPIPFSQKRNANDDKNLMPDAAPK